MYEILMYAGFTLAIIFMMTAVFFFIRNRVPEAVMYFAKLGKKRLTPEEKAEGKKEQEQRTEILKEEMDGETAVLEQESTALLDEVGK